MRNSDHLWSNNNQFAIDESFESESEVRIPQKGYRIAFDDGESDPGVTAQIKRTESVPINASFKACTDQDPPQTLQNNRQ